LRKITDTTADCVALGLATATPVAKPGVLSKGNRKRRPRSVVIGTAASVSGWPAI